MQIFAFHWMVYPNQTVNKKEVCISELTEEAKSSAFNVFASPKSPATKSIAEIRIAFISSSVKRKCTELTKANILFLGEKDV